MSTVFSSSQVGALAACSLLACAAAASEEPLTLGEAQRVAVERSSELEADSFAVSASQEMTTAAGEWPDPILKFGVQNVPVNGEDQFSLTKDFMTMTQVGVMQEFTRPSKRRLRAERAQKMFELARAQRDESEASIKRATALAWFERYYAEATEHSVMAQVAAARLEVSAAEATYRGGQGESSDVLAARGSLAELEDQAAVAARRVRGSKIALGRWLGEAADRPMAGEPRMDVVPLHPHLIESQLAEHSEILTLQRQEELARSEVELARANQHSDWSLELMYSQRGDEFSNMMTLEFSVPLQINRRDRQDRELAAKLAEASRARAQREDMLRVHAAELRVMIDEWQSDRQRLERYSATIIPIATDRTAATMAAYRGGKGRLTEVLAARRNETEVRLQALELEAQASRLWAEITFLTPALDATAVAPSTESTEIEEHP